MYICTCLEHNFAVQFKPSLGVAAQAPQSCAGHLWEHNDKSSDMRRTGWCSAEALCHCKSPHATMMLITMVGAY